MPTFKLVAGRHAHGDKVYIAKKSGQDVIKTDLDLDKIHNQPGAIKFQRLSDEPVKGGTPEPKKDEETEGNDPSSKSSKTWSMEELEQLTVKELHELADEEEIAINKSAPKADLINQLASALELS